MVEKLRSLVAAWWRAVKNERDYCAVCKEYLPPRGGGIDVAHLERVCSEACADEHASRSVW